MTLKLALLTLAFVLLKTVQDDGAIPAVILNYDILYLNFNQKNKKSLVVNI